MEIAFKVIIWFMVWITLTDYKRFVEERGVSKRLSLIFYLVSCISFAGMIWYI